jgi:hypothetical protein
MKKAPKKYIVTKTRRGKDTDLEPMTVEELTAYFSYTLEVGKSWEHEKGNKKINLKPKSIAALVNNYNNAKNNAARNGWADDYITLKGEI